MFTKKLEIDFSFFFVSLTLGTGFAGSTVVKNPPENAGGAGDTGSIPGSGSSPRGGNGKPLQYSCLENSMVRVAWQATVHEITKSQTQLSAHTHTHTHTHTRTHNTWYRARNTVGIY